MTDIDASRVSSMSDAELATYEADRSVPIEVWTAVEAERARREAVRRAPPPAASSTPRAAPASPRSASVGSATIVAPADPRLHEAMQLLGGLLVPGESILAYAPQRRLFALVHRRVIVAATSGRFIALYRRLFGGYTPIDVRWQDLRNADVRAGIFGATLTIASLVSGDLGSQDHSNGQAVIGGLQKDAAQRVYKIAQAQEQAWREKRRVRDLDELRAQSGGIQLGAGAGSGSAGLGGAPAGGDPTDRLRRAKEMLDSGLITDTEYESIKARVVDAL